MASDSITILHLSDVQFGRNHRFGSEEPFDTLCQRLEDDLRQLADEHDLRPEIVAVTGDLAEWGRPKEFEEARECETTEETPQPPYWRKWKPRCACETLTPKKKSSSPRDIRVPSGALASLPTGIGSLPECRHEEKPLRRWSLRIDGDRLPLTRISSFKRNPTESWLFLRMLEIIE